MNEKDLQEFNDCLTPEALKAIEQEEKLNKREAQIEKAKVLLGNLAEESKDADKEFKAIFADFFTELASKQKSLPADIAKIMADNRDYLYQPVPL